VGSGKTVVSMILLLYMVENGYQGALMAPTEILATQHFLSIKNDFEKLGIRVELFTGTLKGKNKEKKLSDLKEGFINIAIGTHALIEENIEFKNLGLVIIDEQHRFGVIQRKRLRDKGVLANLIVMSATPIPRSLALSIYGDLDVSIIDELPPGRKKIKTKWISTVEDYEKMYEFIRKKLGEGRQVYFVAPLIEESEKINFKSVEEIVDEVKERLPEFKSEILHGKMKSSEKDSVMNNFKEKNIDILVSTTVVEVGVNVPNATIMVINDAERFGLSALHQLRGRVGRGEEQSYCFLLSSTQNDTSKARFRIMENTQDGFKIAEEDLRLRKAGEIFGTKQSGLSDLKFADIVHDIKTIKLVREICIEYLKEHNGKIENLYLKEDIESRFKER
jgi:ATP-dependent DNA helicase RecG